jgi:hypothetical protein
MILINLSGFVEPMIITKMERLIEPFRASVTWQGPRFYTPSYTGRMGLMLHYGHKRSLMLLISTKTLPKMEYVQLTYSLDNQFHGTASWIFMCGDVPCMF